MNLQIMVALDLLIALDKDNFPINEYEKLNKILLDPACKYNNFATFIEFDVKNIKFIEKLEEKLVSINTIGGNVSINGLVSFYPDINSFTLYNNCAIQLVKNYNNWSIFIEKSFQPLNAVKWKQA